MTEKKKPLPKEPMPKEPMPKEPMPNEQIPNEQIPLPTKEEVSQLMGKVHQMYTAADDSIDQMKAIIKEMRNLNLQLLTIVNTIN